MRDGVRSAMEGVSMVNGETQGRVGVQWRGSAVKGRSVFREGTMEGEREGQQGWATGTGDRDEQRKTGTDDG